ncbi:putative enoyl-CoA hydratase echA8 [Thalassovita gelatinovora]|uniref:Putative enoyl-CoA hydratase echA8 n=1 Tax=Thalassovita gelatinovora TaxID=53501 RepID=A0A0P1FBD6_THAGE|nr:enoyl-CoA hydratase/isomerase family protein [Thalassovita gelatinovora]QIZ80071.1 enoyl-CoA hydratase/isomerase family protein [Thalassovita gelatinovora]CUH65486.1 putative enoyl-CoA hydratase echA8 [Thalassovita gelatinovora]SER08866.1 Enoyl-CoA hydratase/carnithine racemase [Thalassovita gelatinovora]
MTDFSYDTILSSMTGDGVRTIALNRPNSLNAMNRRLIDDVAIAFDDANRDPQTRAIIFTGKGRAFCAGDDRHEHVHPETEAEARDLVDAIQRATVAIVFGAKPVVGAINGWAVGGGFEWAINCDFPIWAESAKGFFPEVSLNLFVTGAVTSLLPAIAGPLKAREMLFLGQRYPAAELHDCGVAWKVVPDADLQTEAAKVAAQLAHLPTLSVRAMKRVLNQATAGALHRALEQETEATVAGFLDPETTRLLKQF